MRVKPKGAHWFNGAKNASSASAVISNSSRQMKKISVGTGGQSLPKIGKKK